MAGPGLSGAAAGHSSAMSPLSSLSSPRAAGAAPVESPVEAEEATPDEVAEVDRCLSFSAGARSDRAQLTGQELLLQHLLASGLGVGGVVGPIALGEIAQNSLKEMAATAAFHRKSIERLTFCLKGEEVSQLQFHVLFPVLSSADLLCFVHCPVGARFVLDS